MRPSLLRVGLRNTMLRVRNNARGPAAILLWRGHSLVLQFPYTAIPVINNIILCANWGGFT